jgi:putative spermidine/putrescine transport system substrate-binding protein
MEDYELQEVEFWRKLEEESMSRSAMLRRSAAAAFGLTILSSPAAAWAGRSGMADAMTADGIPLKELVKRAKKEGKLNVIALPHDWANYGEIISTFKRKYGLKMDEANPNGSSAQENEAIRSLKGDSRAPDTVDVGPAFAIAGAKEGLYASYKVKTYKSIPKNMKDPRARWYGDYWGAISIGYNANLVKPAPKTFKDLLNSAYKNKVALNGSPLTSGSAVAGVFAAALANGGSLNNIGPGIEFFRRLKRAGNFIPIQATPQTVASGQTPIVLDWDYLNVTETEKNKASFDWQVAVPSDGLFAQYYAQAINKNAPHPAAARLWQEFLYSDEGQNLWLAGKARPVRLDAMTEAGTADKALVAVLPPVQGEPQFPTQEETDAAQQVVAQTWASATA